jgi:hypothetical protein
MKKPGFIPPGFVFFEKIEKIAQYRLKNFAERAALRLLRRFFSDGFS